MQQLCLAFESTGPRTASCHMSRLMLKIFMIIVVRLSVQLSRTIDLSYYQHHTVSL